MRRQNTNGCTPRAGEVDLVHRAENWVTVRFLTMPDWHTRDELKSAGFRWSTRQRAWHGPAEMLPAGVRRVAER